MQTDRVRQVDKQKTKKKFGTKENSSWIGYGGVASVRASGHSCQAVFSAFVFFHVLGPVKVPACIYFHGLVTMLSA